VSALISLQYVVRDFFSSYVVFKGALCYYFILLWFVVLFLRSVFFLVGRIRSYVLKPEAPLFETVRRVLVFSLAENDEIIPISWAKIIKNSIFSGEMTLGGIAILRNLFSR